MELQEINKKPGPCPPDKDLEKCEKPFNMEEDVHCSAPIKMILMEEFFIKTFTVCIYFIILISIILWDFNKEKAIYTNMVRATIFSGIVFLAFRNRNDLQRVKIFNLVLPVSLLISTSFHLAFMEKSDFQSEESWAFFLSALFNVNQSTAIFFDMPKPFKGTFLLCGFAAVISNIERQSENAGQYNRLLYPVFICYVFFLAKIQCRCKELKNQLITELVLKNKHQKKTQNIILENMKQGIALMDLGQDEMMFLNSKLRGLLFQAINSIPECQAKLDNFMAQNSIEKTEDIDLLAPQSLFLLNLQIFNKKHDNQPASLGFGVQHSKLELLSFNDIIKTRESNFHSIYSFNYYVQENFETTMTENESLETRFVQFCLQLVEFQQESQNCQMIQFIDITASQLYDDALRKKNFAQMLNATVSHEMRTPINAIQQSVVAQDSELEELKKMQNKVMQICNSSLGEEHKKATRTLFKKMEKSFEKIGHIDDNMKTSSKLLGFYVQDLLDVSQIKNGTIQKNIKKCDINEILQEILQTQEISAKMKNVDLLFCPFASHDKYMEIDDQRLQQVALNLLSNALKFSKRGGKVELGGQIITKDHKRFVQIYVQDNGHGIKKEDKPKLFKPFGKLRQQNTSINREGIGFGLNTCKQICQVFGGDIDCESIEGLGSKFFFHFQIEDALVFVCDESNLSDVKFENNEDLYTPVKSILEQPVRGDYMPLNQESLEKSIQEEEHDNIKICSERSVIESESYLPSILIADDISSNLIALEFQLGVIKGPDGKNQSCAKGMDGQLLIQLYLERLILCINLGWTISPFQVIITDAQMPFCNGPEAVKQIRQICAWIKDGELSELNIPNVELLEEQLKTMKMKIEGLLKPFIVVYSGMCDDESVKYAQACGCDKYVFKPATVVQLKEAIGPYLGNLEMHPQY